ncbi:protein obstructor-E-like [Pollicipes pollicipes]|uniref:protein obstructor-E-like n=1 Tax=Pollicipes pollicipes TaxID=41117 RepID=UPI0018855CD0|nr:protein obstructor-E-like [Pollicipes pollicipes]
MLRLDSRGSGTCTSLEEAVFMQVSQLDSELCAQVTGMLLELPPLRLARLLQDGARLGEAVCAARAEYLRFTGLHQLLADPKLLQLRTSQALEAIGRADKYYQCIDGVAQERTCQDGLLFHPERPYPCVYPQEVDCLARSGIQDPQPTEDCPRQFALFRTSDAPADCSGFTSCVNGRAFRADCPETLAYNARTLLCQWADEVEDCDAAGYLGFQCPAQEFSPDQVGEFTRQPHPDDCTKYYICLNKEDGSVKPRLQGCPEPTVFDPAKDACNENIEEVPGCENAIAPEVLAAYRDRQAQEDARREARLQEVRSTLDG